MKYRPFTIECLLLAAAFAVSTSGCAANGRPDLCGVLPCEVNPLGFWLQVDPPAGSPLVSQTFSTPPNAPSDDANPFEFAMVAPFLYEGTVRRLGAAPGDELLLEGAAVIAEWTHPITGIEVTRSVLTDSEGSFVLPLLPDQFVRLIIKPPASYPAPPMVIANADGSAMLPSDLPGASPMSGTLDAFEDLAAYFLVDGEVRTAGSSPRPLPNVRVRALPLLNPGTTNEVIESAGVSTITDCDGSFTLHLPPEDGTSYVLRTERLESGAELLCSSAGTEICTPGCESCNAPNDVPVISTTDREVLVDTTPGATVPIPLGVGDDCPPPSEEVQVTFTMNANPLVAPETMLSGTSIRFVSRVGVDGESLLVDGGAYVMTVPAPDIVTGTLSVFLPSGEYDVLVRTGPMSAFASQAFQYVTPMAAGPATLELDMMLKTDLTGEVYLDDVKVPALVVAKEADRPHSGIDADISPPPPEGGSFSLSLSPGFYDLTVTPDEGAPWVERGIEVIAGETNEATIDLLPATRFVGSLIEANGGVWLEDAVVTVFIRFEDGLAYELASTTTSTADAAFGIDGGGFEFLLPNPVSAAARCAFFGACD